ncbi:hypothetical protein [Bradyrhizobium cajani]|uniref:Uncharacterized protein n=1 Tax=Bradyrhizobium cajani TaxID=1928661 RepID=A0A844TNA8_9BRAD|nr:hypothetical protein [Bradyrhizobium cajani]MCP3373158.1 hypothetical protein [Bradyrhizobium cajani]MVT78309.1 hypothetical protein [Bradyrhizobium cajani]
MVAYLPGEGKAGGYARFSERYGRERFRGDDQGASSIVIPGRATWREPGIHFAALLAA